VKFSGAFMDPDGKAFTTGRYDEPKANSLKDTNYFSETLLPKLGIARSYGGTC